MAKRAVEMLMWMALESRDFVPIRMMRLAIGNWNSAAGYSNDVIGYWNILAEYSNDVIGYLSNRIEIRTKCDNRML